MKQALSADIKTYSSVPHAAYATNESTTSVASAYLETKRNSSVFKGTITERIKGAFEFLFNLGIEEEMPFREAKLARFTNMLCVFIVLGIVLYIPYSLATGSFLLAAIEAIDAVFVASALYFSSKKMFSVAKFILIGVVNVFIYINACYIGNAADVQHFYVLINIVPFLVFRLNQYKFITASVIMTVGWFIIYQITYHHFEPYNLPLEVQHGTRKIGTWLDFVLFAIGIFMLAKNNFEIEEELAGSNRTLRMQAVIETQQRRPGAVCIHHFSRFTRSTA